jgi:hypothetical protein
MFRVKKNVPVYIYSYSCSSALRSVRSQHNGQWNFKIDKWCTVDCFSLAPLKNSTPLILACRVADLRTILACAANDFTVSHQTNSLPGNEMYVVRLKKFSHQKGRQTYIRISFHMSVVLSPIHNPINGWRGFILCISSFILYLFFIFLIF